MFAQLVTRSTQASRKKRPLVAVLTVSTSVSAHVVLLNQQKLIRLRCSTLQVIEATTSTTSHNASSVAENEQKKAWRLRHAFFYGLFYTLFYAILFLYSFYISSANAALKPIPACTLETSKLAALDKVSIAKLHDGDSFRLSDQRKVRLLGLNTPEMYKRPQGIREPFALEAKKALEKLSQTLYLAPATSKAKVAKDRYGRLLAHAYNAQGYNISAALIQQGLGFAINIPPHLALSNCLNLAEQEARQAKRGIWQHAYYQPKPSTSLSDNDTGFALISGKVTSAHLNGKTWWIELDEGQPQRAVLRISQSDQAYFTKSALKSLINSQVAVKGWLSSREKPNHKSRLAPSKGTHYAQFVFYLKHPSQFLARRPQTH